jgi:hypothetical protein
MTNTNFQIGQEVTYSVCNSIYTGIVVKVKSNSLIVIDDAAGMELYKAGCACGAEVSFAQVK